MNPNEQQNQSIKSTAIKGRGSTYNPNNPYFHHTLDDSPEYVQEPADLDKPTEFIDVQAKTIVNKVKSQDIGMDFSMNPYQGCEHGCAYCYARNSHTYWGYSAGLDFEQKILIKRTAPELLEKKLLSKNWQAKPIILSGNTDCYQPIERKLEITRKLLEVFWRYRHPVGIITKNSLVLRDIDILEKLAKHQLAKVSISITTLDENLRRKLEPRTATGLKRLETVEKLTAAGIPCSVNIAPIIPGLNDHEILAIAKASADKGAVGIGSGIVRLDKQVGPIFEAWIREFFPDKADKVLNQIRSTHQGKLGDDWRTGTRMVGDGPIAEIINKQLKLARTKFFKNRVRPSYNLEMYERYRSPQLKLF